MEYFRRFGRSNNISSDLTNSSIRGSGNFEITVNGTSHNRDLGLSWRTLSIKSSHSCYLQFCGNWIVDFNNILKGINPIAILHSKGNQQSSSRMKKTPFFKAWALYTNELCECKALLTINDEQHERIRVSCAGNVGHKQCSLKARINNRRRERQNTPRVQKEKCQTFYIVL